MNEELELSKKIIYDGKEFRIYIWENKEFGDFPMPKGFNFAEFHDFCELVNNKKIKPNKWEVFVAKNPLPSIYPLFYVCYGVGDWDACWCGFGSSGDYGRAVVSKELGGQDE